MKCGVFKPSVDAKFIQWARAKLLVIFKFVSLESAKKSQNIFRKIMKIIALLITIFALSSSSIMDANAKAKAKSTKASVAKKSKKTAAKKSAKTKKVVSKKTKEKKSKEKKAILDRINFCYSESVTN